MSDEDLFREAMRDVRPIASDRVERRGPLPPPEARSRRADQRQVLDESLDPASDIAPFGTGDDIAFRRGGVSATVLRRLRRRHYAIEAEIDLHGYTAVDARAALAAFLAECVAAGKRCVRVVHGKGLRSGQRGPVLKPKINRWLRQWDSVLAFASAPRLDGGTGALYVLLRKQ